MNGIPKTLHAKTEAELAGYQTRQEGNTCSFHAIAVGLHLLLNYTIDPLTLSDEVNRMWWRGRFMRVAPDWAVTPRMQMRIVRHIAQTHSLPINAVFHPGNPDTLHEMLTDPTIIPIITIIWRWRQAPPIYLGSTNQNFNITRSAGGHSMLLGAYDPQHSANGQFMTPWGFINPWKNHTDQLFWMTDTDFRRAWRFWLPGIGRHPLVVIQRAHL